MELLMYQSIRRASALSAALCIILIAQASLLAQQACGQTVIVKNGQPAATIVLHTEAGAADKSAAEELQKHIELISGAKLEIVEGAADVKGVPIYIGGAASPAAQNAIADKSDEPAAFCVQVTADKVFLAGNGDEGTQYAVYDLLNQLGVHWLIPGDVGLEYDEMKTVTLKQQMLVEAPAFGGRILQAIGDREWAIRNKLGGWTAGGHGLGVRFDKEARPDLFYKYPSGRTSHQEKVSEPEVIEAVIKHWRAKLEKNPDIKYMGIGPHDGSGFGTDPWDAEDFDPILGAGATTDRYIKFFNTVLEDIQKDYPDVGIAFYAYTRELRPPVRETPNKNILPMIAAIGLDRFHSIDNPLSWEKKYLRTVVEGWKEQGVNLAYRGYLFNLADHGLPFSMIDIVADEFPYYHKNNMVSMRIECIPNWGYHAPALYLATQLFWDPYQDSEAIMDEWFDRMYGPAAAPMKKHFEIIENAYINGDFYTGNVFDVPKIITPEIRKQLGQTLAQAEKLAKGNEKVAARVDIVRLAYEYGEASFRQMDAFMHGDFATAKKEHDRIMGTLIPEMTREDRTPSVIARRSHVGYYKRFWGRSVENAYERTINGREVATVLPDEWLFMLDPYGAGEDLFLFDPEVGTGSWTPIKTHSATASNQGLRYYKWKGWYRTKIDVPAKYEGRTMRFWMGGVDDTPRVWIDGVELTQIARGAAPIGRPFEFDCTDAIKPGTTQTVVVSVADNSVNELGTFGINGPVMIWAEPEGVKNELPEAKK